MDRADLVNFSGYGNLTSIDAGSGSLWALFSRSPFRRPEQEWQAHTFAGEAA